MRHLFDSLVQSLDLSLALVDFMGQLNPPFLLLEVQLAHLLPRPFVKLEAELILAWAVHKHAKYYKR